jgi:hypothetical protein
MKISIRGLTRPPPRVPAFRMRVRECAKLGNVRRYFPRSSPSAQANSLS